MTTEERGDARLALIVVIVAVGVGFFVGRAMACESYEECMSIVVNQGQEVGPYYKDGELIGYTNTTEEGFLLKAIAFKLDEISTLLKQQRSHMMNLAQSYAKKSAKPDAQIP